MDYSARNILRQPKILLLCYWAISTPFLAVIYLMLPVSPDHALFDYMAWLRINGAHYYADVAEQNWPGIIFIHELGIRTFGVHFWTYRLTDFINLQIGCLGLFLFLKRCKFSLAPYFVLALYPPLYITAGVWMAGQRDIVGAQLLFLGTALMLVDASTSRFAKSQVIAAGLVMAEAVLIRPTYLAYPPVALAIYWALTNYPNSRRFQSVKHPMLFACGFLVLLSVVLLWGLYSQNLDDWYEQAIIFNLVYREPDLWSNLLFKLVQWTIHSWHWLTLFSGIGFILWIWTRGFWAEALYVAGIIGTILLSYFVQRKDFIYHVAGLLTVYAVLIAVLLDELWHRSRQPKLLCKSLLVGAFLSILIVVITGTMSKLRMYQPMLSQIYNGPIVPVDIGKELNVTTEIHAAAIYIINHSSANDYILQWGRAFHVGFLAQRKSTTRYVSTPIFYVSSSNGLIIQSWQTEFARDLAEKRPKFVVLSTYLVKSQDNHLDPIGIPPIALQTLLDLLSHGYTKVYEGKSLILMQAE